AETLCNMVKLFASEEILKVAQHCLELHGGNGVMLDFGVEKIYRDAAIFLHMDATVDISKLKIVKSMFPATAGKKARAEGFPSSTHIVVPPKAGAPNHRPWNIGPRFRRGATPVNPVKTARPCRRAARRN